MNNDKITSKAISIMIINIIVLIGVITFIFIWHETLHNRTQKLAWIIQQKNYSPRLELSLIHAEECSQRYEQYTSMNTQTQDDSLLLCYNNIELVRKQARAYSKWNIINTTIQNFYNDSNITPTLLSNLNNILTESGSTNFRIDTNIREQLVLHLRMAHSIIYDMLKLYQNNYPDRENLRFESYYFRGNSIERYVVCLTPERMGFATSEDCNTNLSSFDYASPPESN